MGKSKKQNKSHEICDPCIVDRSCKRKKKLSKRTIWRRPEPEEEIICCDSAINILGSNNGIVPFDGLVGPITDRSNPVNGDQWYNPETGDSFIYNGTSWDLVPCCNDAENSQNILS